MLRKETKTTISKLGNILTVLGFTTIVLALFLDNNLLIGIIGATIVSLVAVRVGDLDDLVERVLGHRVRDMDKKTRLAVSTLLVVFYIGLISTTQIIFKGYLDVGAIKTLAILPISACFMWVVGGSKKK